MIELGIKQTLEIVKKVEFGVYVGKSGEPEAEAILLPIKQVPAEAKIGDSIEVFVYRDSKDRMIATVNQPKISLHELAELTVSEVGKFGAFLDWGLEKDLLLPFKEQTKQVQPGDKCLVAMYLDKSSRLCATMNVYEYLSKESPYKKDDTVTGRVYEISQEFGVFVAVDNQYSALIPKKELFVDVQIGQDISARVTSVKEDGKLDLSLRQKAYLQMDADAKTVYERIVALNGVLPFNDKAAPELIRDQMHMSKNEFKRAVGNLLKSGKIEITNSTIKIRKE